MNKLYSTEEIERIIKRDYIGKLYEYIDDQSYTRNDIFYEEGSKDKIDGLYVWTNNYGYNYMQVERGNVNDYVVTQDFTDILYIVLDNYIFDIACDYELKHRDSHKDFRRLLFNKRKELWNILDEKCYQRCCEDIDKRLEMYPFDDELSYKQDHRIKSILKEFLTDKIKLIFK